MTLIILTNVLINYFYVLKEAIYEMKIINLSTLINYYFTKIKETIFLEFFKN